MACRCGLWVSPNVPYGSGTVLRHISWSQVIAPPYVGATKMQPDNPHSELLGCRDFVEQMGLGGNIGLDEPFNVATTITIVAPNTPVFPTKRHPLITHTPRASGAVEKCDRRGLRDYVNELTVTATPAGNVNRDTLNLSILRKYSW
ncbi:hypothetical protein AJ78_04030 [Emergomyces pasteurianus Ep9510]|uniref:Uncharacterized protein n=1 Tax=Emergomyces pasteurianus Ep9510 TaxID=1447872 RepID=A0A1J9QIL3_9EURO|nr:hypothetical protein AJ78_04030 [Emergomyces pasteurianus Ep9510]